MVLHVKVEPVAWGQSCWPSAWTVEGPAWDYSWLCPEAAPCPAVRSLGRGHSTLPAGPADPEGEQRRDGDRENRPGRHTQGSPPGFGAK